MGGYVRIDGSLVSAPSLSQVVASKDEALDAEMQSDLSATRMALGRIKTATESGFAFDQMLEAGNTAGENLVIADVNSRIKQTRSIEHVVSALDLSQRDAFL